MLLNTVSLDYTNKFTSWSLLNYCYTCRSAPGPEDSQNRIKTRQGNKQLKNGSVKGSWIKASSRKAQNQQCHSIIRAVPFWPGSTAHERPQLGHSSSHTEQRWPQAWLFPKGHVLCAAASSYESFSLRLRASVGISPSPSGDEAQLRNGRPSWTFPSSSGGCSFQESSETCYRASGKKDLKKLVTDSKAPAHRCKAWARTTTKCQDYSQGLAGNMAR